MRSCDIYIYLYIYAFSFYFNKSNLFLKNMKVNATFLLMFIFLVQHFLPSYRWVKDV